MYLYQYVYVHIYVLFNSHSHSSLFPAPSALRHGMDQEAPSFQYPVLHPSSVQRPLWSTRAAAVSPHHMEKPGPAGRMDCAVEG